jgi:CheY-like chemotaxis protein
MARVMVIDDEEMILKLMRRVLAAHEVVCERTTKEALDRLGRGELFDAILVDLSLPRLTGIGLYEDLHRHFPDAARRLIFMTGGAGARPIEEFLRSVPNIRFHKPFGPRDVAFALRSLLDSIKGA